MAPILYNSTGTIGEAITAFTTNIGGNIFLTLFILLLFIFLLAIVLGVALIYMGILFAKYYFTSR